MAKINTTNYQPVTSWNGTQDLLIVEQPDGTKVATPEQIKQFVLNDMDEVPTQNSDKPVESGGVFNAIEDSVSIKSAIGNPITLTDAANANAEELSMTIEPIQSGSGDPSPTNVRPISGISEAVATRTGKNLIDESALIAAELDPTTGQPSASTDVKITPMISIKSSATYLFAHQNGDAFRIFAYATDGTFIERSDLYRDDAVVTTGATWAYLRIQGANFAWANTDPVLTHTADITITFGQTVYGGSVNFKTGVVTVTYGIVDLGTLTYSYNAGNTRFLATVSDMKSVNDWIAINTFCSQYKKRPMAPGWNENNTYGTYATTIYLRDTRFTDPAAFKTAMSGVQLCYELATPTTLTLTPAELELLKGNNTISCNGAEISIEYYPDNAIGVLAGRVDTAIEIQNNAGFHNSIYRGKSLGSEVTAEQYAAISAGTFDDMYIGDYWTIGGVNYRIAHFNYWFDCGDIACRECHVLIVPDTNLYSAKMNNSHITTGAYVGSAMYTTNLAQAKTTINTAFGSGHILSHREYLANAMNATADPTYESAGSWYDSTVELMNERMVYGADIFHNIEVNGAIPTNYTIGKSQLALFALDPSRICNRAHWWLRCAVSAAHFAHVGGNGLAAYDGARNSLGVRPAFGIKA